MALFKIKLKTEYTVDLLVSAESAEEAMRLGALEAATAVENAFIRDRNGSSAAGQSTPISATCVNSLE